MKCHRSIPNLLLLTSHVIPHPALLAVSVAGLGMIGMFWLGNWMSQVIKALKGTSPEGLLKGGRRPIPFTSQGDVKRTQSPVPNMGIPFLPCLRQMQMADPNSTSELPN